MTESLFLDSTKVAKIHEATLVVLERTGIRLEHPRVETLLLEAGAKKDEDGRILLPRELVQGALDKVRRGFVLYDREGKEALELKHGATYFGTGSDALKQVDLRTNETRDSTLDDVGRNVRIADALEFDFVMSMALPREVPSVQLYPRIFAEMVRNTDRPIVTTAVSVDDLKHIHEIASIAVGGKEDLKQKPFYLVYVEPISPLHFDEVCVDKLLHCVENDIPFVFASGANLGTGAPITPEGSVVQGSAESLAGLVIALLVNDRARFVYGANSAAADMRTGLVCYGSTEWSKTVAMYAELGRHYELPSWGAGGSTDAREVDAQAAWEAYRGIFLSLQSQSTLVHDMGYMALGELYDLRMVVLVKEMVAEARHVLKPVDVSDEALSTAVIDEVSRGSSLYLSHLSTAKNFREALFMSRLIDRSKIGSDERGNLLSALGDRVEELLSKEPSPIESSTNEAIEKYCNLI